MRISWMGSLRWLLPCKHERRDSAEPLLFLLVVIIVNPGCIKPIYGFQVGIFCGIADTHDGIGLHILGQAKEFCQRSLSAKLRMDILFAIASIIALPAIPFSKWPTAWCSHK